MIIATVSVFPSRFRPPSNNSSALVSRRFVPSSSLLIFFLRFPQELEGVPMSQGILVNVFEHSHQYFSLGIRLYFGTIPGKSVP